MYDDLRLRIDLTELLQQPQIARPLQDRVRQRADDDLRLADARVGERFALAHVAVNDPHAAPEQFLIHVRIKVDHGQFLQQTRLVAGDLLQQRTGGPRETEQENSRQLDRSDGFAVALAQIFQADSLQRSNPVTQQRVGVRQSVTRSDRQEGERVGNDSHRRLADLARLQTERQNDQ